jgi:hypothetical protein
MFEAVIASQRVGAKRRPMTGFAKQSRATKKVWMLRFARNDDPLLEAMSQVKFSQVKFSQVKFSQVKF